MTNLRTDDRTLVTTNLRHAKTVTVEGITLDVPENCPTVAVQRRLDGKWYAGSEKRSACSDSLVGAVRECFGMCQTDIEDIPDLSAEEAMNVARDALSY